MSTFLEIFPWKQSAQVAHVPWAFHPTLSELQFPMVSLEFFSLSYNMLVECWYSLLFDRCWCKESFCEHAKCLLVILRGEKVHSIGVPIEVTEPLGVHLLGSHIFCFLRCIVAFKGHYWGVHLFRSTTTTSTAKCLHAQGEVVLCSWQKLACHESWSEC